MKGAKGREGELEGAMGRGEGGYRKRKLKGTKGEREAGKGL